MIYRLHLPSTISITLCSHPNTTKSDLGVNILLTCRQVYLEAVQYAYSNRLFKSSRSCKLCRRPLTLTDTNFLKSLQQSAIDKIERLELAVHVNCAASYRAGISSYRAARAKTPDVRLCNTAKMQSLNCLSIKVVLVDFVCCIPAHAIKHAADRLAYLGLDDLIVHVHDAIPERIEVRWEAEVVDKGMPEGKLEATTEAATESLRRLAKRYQVSQKGASMRGPGLER